MLFPGAPAPDLAARDDRGRATDLVAYRGRWIVLWWYAKASTGG